jgi:hypothetical protein
MRIAVMLILLATAALSQNPTPGASTTLSTPTQGAQQPGAASQPPQAQAPEVPADAPVITLHGFCPSMPANTDQKSAECKTIITRAQFEKLVDTLGANMPGSVRQRLAQDYSQMLVLSDQAKKRGLDKTQRFEDIISFMKMRVLAQEYLTNVQETSKPSTADVEKHYQDNKNKYEELTLNRLFIPRNRPPAAAKAAEPKPLTDAELQAQAEKYRARLVAGESFEKLQKEAYEAAGFKTPPPPTVTSKRREGAPASEAEVFTLKKGDLSKTIVDAAGASVYQVQDTKMVPLEQVKPEIEAQLASEKMKQQLESLSNVAKPDLNQAYFSSFKTEEPVRAMTPGGAPMPSPRVSGSPSSSPKPATPKTGSTAPKATPKK